MSQKGSRVALNPTIWNLRRATFQSVAGYLWPCLWLVEFAVMLILAHDLSQSSTRTLNSNQSQPGKNVKILESQKLMSNGKIDKLSRYFEIMICNSLWHRCINFGLKYNLVAKRSRQQWPIVIKDLETRCAHPTSSPDWYEHQYHAPPSLWSCCVNPVNLN